VKNIWVDLEYNKEYGAAIRRSLGGEGRYCKAELRQRAKLQRFNNEEVRREEGEKS
jgi:hypothetical protein